MMASLFGDCARLCHRDKHYYGNQRETTRNLERSNLGAEKEAGVCIHTHAHKSGSNAERSMQASKTERKRVRRRERRQRNTREASGMRVCAAGFSL